MTHNSQKTNKQNVIIWAAEMAPLAKSLLCEHEGLSSYTRNLRKTEQPGVAAQAGNPSAGGGETDDSCGSLANQHGQMGVSQASDRPCLKNQGGWYLQWLFLIVKLTQSRSIWEYSLHQGLSTAG